MKKNLVNILVSTDSGTRETYKKIKLVDKHNNVWNNIKKYAKHQQNDLLVKTKYIIIPRVNDNEKEIREFIDRNIEAGVKHCLIVVEIGWFCLNSANISEQKQLIELYQYAKEYGKQKGINTNSFDRLTIIKEKKE